jgi:hypothetical protein
MEHRTGKAGSGYVIQILCLVLNLTEILIALARTHRGPLTEATPSTASFLDLL